MSKSASMKSVGKLIVPKGQSLVEVVIGLSVAIVVITALIILVVNSLRNAQFATNQSIATKYAQEGMEIVKTIKERDVEAITGDLNYTDGGTQKLVSQFSNLWLINLVNGYFILVAGNKLNYTGNQATYETVGINYQRQVIIEDDNNLTSGTAGYEKRVTVKVTWSDASGQHESNIQSVLTKR